MVKNYIMYKYKKLSISIYIYIYTHVYVGGFSRILPSGLACYYLKHINENNLLVKDSVMNKA